MLQHKLVDLVVFGTVHCFIDPMEFKETFSEGVHDTRNMGLRKLCQIGSIERKEEKTRTNCSWTGSGSVETLCCSMWQATKEKIQSCIVLLSHEANGMPAVVLGIS